MPKPSPDAPALMRRAFRQCAMFSGWPDAVLERLVADAVLKQHRRRSVIPAQEDGRKQMLLVVSGALETSGLNADGSRFVLSVLGPGEITPLMNLLDRVELNYTFQARDDSTLVHLPVESLRAALDETPLLWRDVALVALARQQGSITMMHRQALASLPQKLAQALIRLAQWSGRPLDRSEGVTLRVSQADIAAMVAVSRQTVNKEMQLLAQHGMVSVRYGQLTIHDVAGLRRLAEGGSLPDGPRA